MLLRKLFVIILMFFALGPLSIKADEQPRFFHIYKDKTKPSRPKTPVCSLCVFYDNETMCFIFPNDVLMLDVVVLDEREMVLWQGCVTAVDSEIFFPELEGLVTIKCTDEKGIHYIGSAIF